MGEVLDEDEEAMWTQLHVGHVGLQMMIYRNQVRQLLISKENCRTNQINLGCVNNIGGVKEICL